MSRQTEFQAERPASVTVAFLRWCSNPLRCIRCGSWYEQVQLRPAYTGETWAHCPRCEEELLAPVRRRWPDSRAGVLAGAALMLAACAAWAMVLR